MQIQHRIDRHDLPADKPSQMAPQGAFPTSGATDNKIQLSIHAPRIPSTAPERNIPAEGLVSCYAGICIFSYKYSGGVFKETTAKHAAKPPSFAFTSFLPLTTFRLTVVVGRVKNDKVKSGYVFIRERG